MRSSFIKGDLFLSVTKVVVYLRVAGLTKAHKVVTCVSAAFGNGQNVVNFLYRGQPAFLKAQLAEGMLCRIAVTDAFPCSAVLLIDIRGAFVSVVAVAFRFCMLLTVLSTLDGKPRTTGVTARSAWFPRHGVTSVCGRVHGACI